MVWISEDFETITAGCCDMMFAVPRVIYDRWRKTKETWHCPGCGSNRHFTGKTDEQILRDKVRRIEAQRDAAERQTEEVTRAAFRTANKLDKLRTRVKNGVCPCCRRPFENLARHMKTKHPAFGKTGDGLKEMRLALEMSQSDLAHEIGISAAYVSMYERGKAVSVAAHEKLRLWIEDAA